MRLLVVVILLTVGGSVMADSQQETYEQRRMELAGAEVEWQERVHAFAHTERMAEKWATVATAQYGVLSADGFRLIANLGSKYFPTLIRGLNEKDAELVSLCRKIPEGKALSFWAELHRVEAIPFETQQSLYVAFHKAIKEEDFRLAVAVFAPEGNPPSPRPPVVLPKSVTGQLVEEFPAQMSKHYEDLCSEAQSRESFKNEVVFVYDGGQGVSSMLSTVRRITE